MQRELSFAGMRCGAACGQGLRTQRSMRMHFLLSAPSLVRITSEWSNTEAGRGVQVSFGVACTSDGRQDEELDTRKSKASAVMRALHYSVVMKRELSKKAKLSIFKAIFVPFLTYGRESWIRTERMRSQVQASEMRFFTKNRRSYTV